MSQITMDERRGFTRRVTEPWKWFGQMKFGLPFDTMKDVYRYWFTDKEWAAFRYLYQQKPSAFSVGSRLTLHWTATQGGNAPSVKLPLPEGFAGPVFEIHLDELPEQSQRKIRPWICDWQRHRQLGEILEDRINGMLGNPGSWTPKEFLDPCVNTPGQIYRIWPELQPFFYPQWKSVTRNKKVKSKLPEDLGWKVPDCEVYGGHGWATVDRFRCRTHDTPAHEKQSWDAINDTLRLLALAVEDLKPVGNYPTIYGGFDI